MSIDPVSSSGSTENPDTTTNQSSTENSEAASTETQETSETEKEHSSKNQKIIDKFLDSGLLSEDQEEKLEKNEAQVEKGMGYSEQIKKSSESNADASQQETLESIDAYNTEEMPPGNDTSASGSQSKSKSNSKELE